MHTRTVLLLVFLLSLSKMLAQETYNTPTDARSISMGESFVAVDGNQQALFYNPAGLANIHGVEFTYSQRGFDWNQFTKGTKYNFFDIALATPFANFAFSYNRFEWGKLEYSDQNGNTVVHNPFQYTLALGASHSFENGISVGIAAKLDDFSSDGTVVRTPSQPGGVPEDQQSTPFLFDFGFLYSVRLNSNMPGTQSKFTIGLSLQNFGTDRVLKDVNGRIFDRGQLDRFLRAGLAYSIGTVAEEDYMNPIFATVTLEYRNRLNHDDFGTRDFYGLGLEATAFEVATIRIGGTMSNIKNIYGNKAFALRYGFGINAQLKRLGIDVPLAIRFDYASIPINKELAYSNLYNFKTTSLGVFTFTLQYTNDIF